VRIFKYAEGCMIKNALGDDATIGTTKGAREHVAQKECFLSRTL
jgi:hypothetical protein